MRTTLSPNAIACLACAALLVLALCTGSLQHKTAAPAALSTLTVRVTDGMTGKPIPGAAVIVGETGKRFFCDNSGATPPIALPAGGQGGLFSSPTATLLIGAPGYLPTVILNVQGKAGQNRSGPEVMLFTKSSTAAPYVLYFEQPDALQIIDALQRFSID
nr:hypothetical protein [bacterium]